MESQNFSSARDIIFTYQRYSLLQTLLNQIEYSILVLACDENTYQYCYPKIVSYLPQHHLIQIQSGEENKNLATCQKVWEEMTALKLDRKAFIVNLGGGVLLDMLGFCAKTYKRGIRFLNIPTTLLSQVDASVGGKLGIDFLGYKNHIGLFANPEKVWIDIDFLESLEEREFVSGFAEIIKHCLIQDKAAWKLLQTHSNLIDLEKVKTAKEFWLDLIKHSVEIKAEVVQQDPKEQGLRKVLNFGHTIGHALESFYLETQKSLLHGEAIAIGMMAEAYISYQKNFIKEENLKEILAFISSIYPKYKIAPKDIPSISLLTLQDKKNENNKIQMTLLAEIGKAVYNQEVSLDLVQDALSYVASIHK